MMSRSPARRILVVEDEWMIADQIACGLVDAGYEVVGPCGRVEQASDLVERGDIDAALIDINVNGNRSFALAERLALAAIPFAFLSGYSGAELPVELKNRPLLQKPVHAAAVRRCVVDLLRPTAFG
jgi:DNA-binding response OmpR family regulator